MNHIQTHTVHYSKYISFIPLRSGVQTRKNDVVISLQRGFNFNVKNATDEETIEVSEMFSHLTIHLNEVTIIRY